MAKFYFHRTSLAKDIADALLEAAPFLGLNLAPQPASGTFLSAQRRRGKTSFLRKDLIPELMGRGLLVVYVDLWQDKSADPQELLYSAIDRAMESISAGQGWASKTAGKSIRKVESVGIPGVATVRLKLGADSWRKNTLSETLAAIHAARAADKKVKDPRIVLILDEAQQALATEAGMNMMFALKSARDMLNTGSDDPQLLMVFTGSSRSKLSSLIASNKAPFMGAKISEFPALGMDYCDAVAAHFNQMLKETAQFSPDAVARAFQILNFKPESLMAAIATAFATPAPTQIGKPPNMPAGPRLLEAAREQAAEERESIERTFKALTPLQQSVLLAVLAGGDTFSPYSAEARAQYAKGQGKKAAETSANAQNALSALVEQEILWKPARGGYQVDDELWLDWLQNRKT